MSVIKKTQCFVFTGLLIVFFTVCDFSVHAKTEDYATVASPVSVVGDVNDRDIISYNVEKDIYIPSESFADESVLGVIVDDPVLYMESQSARADNARPVVRFGEVLVNVSTLGGIIKAGDIVTTSEIPGVGQKAKREDTPYILGFALNTMSLNGDEVVYDGSQVFLGTVSIALRIGPYITKEGAMFLETGMEDFESYVSDVYKEGGMSTPEEVGAFKVFRYLLAAIVAGIAVSVSVSRFGDTFKEGIVSIGRNPLARSQIRLMLFWNVVLIVLVTTAGLGIAAAIILFP